MILVADLLDEAGIALLRASEFPWRAVQGREELEQLVSVATALLVRSATHVDEQLLDAAPQLRVIGRAGVGLDHIDVVAARRKGIVVLNTPDANTRSAAEHTVGMLIACVRSIAAADAQLKRGLFDRGDPSSAFELAGETVGIVGLGRIGGAVARLLHGFGMEILANDPYIEDSRFTAHHAREVPTLEALAPLVRVLTVHTPLNQETRGLISEQVIARMPRGAVLLNCARGGVVDEAALLAGLESGHLAAAACDVFVGEPRGEGSAEAPARLQDETSARLAAHPKVVATPHIGARTRQAQRRMSVDAVNGVLSVLRADATPRESASS